MSPVGMTPDERLWAFLRNEKVDRVPFIPFILGYCHKLSSCTLAEIYADPEKSFKAQMETREIHGWEGFPFFGYSSYGAWEFGGEIEFPYGEYDQAPKIKSHPITEAGQIESLEVPDVKTAGIIPRMMAFSKLQEKHGMPITVHNGSPFSRIGNVIGLDTVLKMIIKTPDRVHGLMRKITDFCLQVTEYWVETFGPEKIISFDGIPVESEQVISPKQFEEFAFPYLKEMHEKVSEMGIRQFWTHLCGKQENNLHLLSRIPYGEPGIVSVSEQVDLKLAHKHFGHNYAIAGNVDPVLINFGTPQEVFDATKETLQIGKQMEKGFVLMGGCEIAPSVPPINIHYMMKALEEFGWYD
jgi:uroporphyrinogen decarboxylase